MQEALVVPGLVDILLVDVSLESREGNEWVRELARAGFATILVCCWSLSPCESALARAAGRRATFRCVSVLTT